MVTDSFILALRRWAWWTITQSRGYTQGRTHVCLLTWLPAARSVGRGQKAGQHSGDSWLWLPALWQKTAQRWFSKLIPSEASAHLQSRSIASSLAHRITMLWSVYPYSCQLLVHVSRRRAETCFPSPQTLQLACTGRDGNIKAREKWDWRPLQTYQSIYASFGTAINVTSCFKTSHHMNSTIYNNVTYWCFTVLT